MIIRDWVRDWVAFITALLENVGADIDPVLVIRRIPEGLEIPGLKQSLMKIQKDYNLQVRIQIYLMEDLSEYSWAKVSIVKLIVPWISDVIARRMSEDSGER